MKTFDNNTLYEITNLDNNIITLEEWAKLKLPSGTWISMSNTILMLGLDLNEYRVLHKLDIEKSELYNKEM